MEKYCSITMAPSEDKSFNYFPEIAKFLSKWSASEGCARVFLGSCYYNMWHCSFLFCPIGHIYYTLDLEGFFFIFYFLRLVLASVDCVVWPSNAAYLNGVVKSMQSLLAMSPLHGGHLQMPVHHGQTVATALLKHTRHLQDSCLTAGLDITNQVSIYFDQNSQQHQGDKRRLMHPCHFLSSTSHENCFWMDSAPVQTGIIGPCRLIRVQDMIGYDQDTRPGAAARLEQMLARVLTRFNFFRVGLVSLGFLIHGFDALFSMFTKRVLVDHLRKGVLGHLDIVQNFVNNPNLKEGDIVIWVDLLPNRLVVSNK
jgi:hypothetical protein